MTRRVTNLAVTLLAAAATQQARATAALSLFGGERIADFHAMTGGKGYDTATGTDFTATVAADPIKDFPVSLGVFYSSQTYSLSGAHDLFDAGSVTELGPELRVTYAWSHVRAFLRWADTLSGTFNGSINGNRTLVTGAGETSYLSGCTWTSSLTGTHMSAGAMFGTENLGGGLVLDVAYLHSQITAIEYHGHDYHKAYAPYMKTEGDLDSTALMLVVEARL